MAEKPLSQNLPADLPTDWAYGQTVAPQGSQAGLAEQYGYNYLMQQVNSVQTAANTINNAFPDLAAKTDLPDASDLVYTLSASYSGTVHALTGLSNVSGLVSCVFTAAANYTAGDTFTVDGTPYTIQLSNGEAAEDNLFVSGATVSVVIDTAGKKINFKAAGGVKLPAETIALIGIFVFDTTWIVPQTGKYRVLCVGKGGAGGNSGSDYSGGGGASGGWCQSLLTLNKNEQYQITVNDAQSSFGSLMTATAGQNGCNSYASAEEPRGATGGTAVGGNEKNYQGTDTGTPGRQYGIAGGNIPHADENKFLVSAPGSAGVYSYGSGGSPLSENQKYSPFGNGSGGNATPNIDEIIPSPSGAIIIELVLE